MMYPCFSLPKSQRDTYLIHSSVSIPAVEILLGIMGALVFGIATKARDSSGYINPFPFASLRSGVAFGDLFSPSSSVIASSSSNILSTANRSCRSSSVSFSGIIDRFGTGLSGREGGSTATGFDVAFLGTAAK